MVELKADVNFRCRDLGEVTPLMVATRFGALEIFKFLVDEKADINEDYFLNDVYRISPIFIARVF